jgi:hypothetical protein
MLCVHLSFNRTATNYHRALDLCVHVSRQPGPTDLVCQCKYHVETVSQFCVPEELIVASWFLGFLATPIQLKGYKESHEVGNR